MEMDAVCGEGCIANLPFSAFRPGLRIPGLTGSPLNYLTHDSLEKHQKNLGNRTSEIVTLICLSVKYEKASPIPQRAMLRLALPGWALRPRPGSAGAVRRGRNAVPIRTRQGQDARFRRNDLQFSENFSYYCLRLDRRPDLSRIIKGAHRQVWRWIFLAEVRVQEGEPLENALRRFKRKVQQEDIIKEVKRHSYYLKPGEKKRVKAALARKRNRKKARKEQD